MTTKPAPVVEERAPELPDALTQQKAPPPPPTTEETEQVLGLTTQKPAPAPPPSVRMGIAPTTIEEAWRMAKFYAESELVPKNYRKRPADILVAIQYGMEMGLPPMAALTSIFVTNGRAALFGDGLLAVVLTAPVYRDHDEYYLVGGERREFLTAADLAKDDTAAVCTFHRTDSPRPRTALFSIADAKKAGLWSKEGPWRDYPPRMLRHRARGFAAHDAFPDVLRGMQAEADAIDLPPVDPPEVRRASETKEPVVVVPDREPGEDG